MTYWTKNNITWSYVHNQIMKNWEHSFDYDRATCEPPHLNDIPSINIYYRENGTVRHSCSFNTLLPRMTQLKLEWKDIMLIEIHRDFDRLCELPLQLINEQTTYDVWLYLHKPPKDFEDWFTLKYPNIDINVI